MIYDLSIHHFCIKTTIFYVFLILENNVLFLENNVFLKITFYFSNSMSEVRESRMSGGYCEGVIDATNCKNDRLDWKNSDRSQIDGPNSPERSGSHRTRLQRGTPMRGSLPANFNRSQTERCSNDTFIQNHQPDLSRSHDVSRKNSTVSSQTRRGSSGSNTSFTIKPDNVKVTPTNKDEWKITIKISREKDESDDYRYVIHPLRNNNYVIVSHDSLMS